ncbi:hypothetical protein PF002_g32979 [Phytophthora fragariae]|uniref:Uncharacterized protein n=1 Tax=Phytophthora fragariae TaxID=53985 RepID=A0A6A3V3I8_9STRA|nr:hypothetical protein PF003_g27506 [Phytophthora fragariae]KAE9158947.1 hypothetical protein PF002_g32979 [Phytophthora fragariae]
MRRGWRGWWRVEEGGGGDCGGGRKTAACGGGQAEEDSVRVDAAEDGGLQAAEEDGRGQRTVACGDCMRRRADKGRAQVATAEVSRQVAVEDECVQLVALVV